MSGVNIEENVVIGKGGDRDLLVDIIKPVNLSGPVPGILFLPGGGWRRADRTPLTERYGIGLANHGYVCVAGEYRVMDEARWPAQIQDVKASIRWMRANAEMLGIDPSLIVVAGKSAGGHLALLAAGTPDLKEFEGDGGNPTVSSRVAAVVGVSPVTTVIDRARTPDFEPMFGKDPSDELVIAASPVSYADANYPPALFLHGTSDDRVPHSTTMVMYQKLEDAGVPVDLHLFAGQDHFFDREPHFYRAVTDAMHLFISRYVPVKEAVTAS
ncbi:MAG: alpha/beta hydrolase [Chloroflexi bacterium]|nr:alpha/beta hydrolase [Chloroflexota bacterium]